MKIMILQTAYKKAADYGTFYNVQELGLARALAGAGHEVILYKALDGEREPLNEYDGKLTSVFMNVKYIGINGLIDVNLLDKTADVLIYFCDTQIKVPSVYKWCKRNDVRFYPYIGVIESHSEKLINRLIMGFVARRDLSLYKECICLGKTPDIIRQLEDKGCRRVVHFPVGLDTTILNDTQAQLQRTYNDESTEEKKLLYIGRMEEEKHPLEMVEIFGELINKNCNVSLTMIGDGYLFDRTKEAVDSLICETGIDEKRLKLIKKVPYTQMHEYYRDADVYVNLNRVEILGMSILEAMYYGCTVVAIKAPGPCFLLEDGTDKFGVIASDKDEVVYGIEYCLNADNSDRIADYRKSAYERVRDKFCWDALAERLLDIIK